MDHRNTNKIVVDSMVAIRTRRVSGVMWSMKHFLVSWVSGVLEVALIMRDENLSPEMRV